jgi:hypothetical protein
VEDSVPMAAAQTRALTGRRQREPPRGTIRRVAAPIGPGTDQEYQHASPLLSSSQLSFPSMNARLSPSRRRQRSYTRHIFHYLERNVEVMERRRETTERVAVFNPNEIREGERVYFDTNIFDPATGISDTQLASIRNSCGGTLRLVFGVECFEEALLNLNSSESDKALEHVRRIFRWTDDRLIAKPVDELICDDIIAYSNGRRSSPWLENPTLAIVRKGLWDVRRLDMNGLKREFAPEIDELRRRRSHFVSTFEQTVCELSSDQFILENKRTEFPDFYRLTATTVAKNFARMTEPYRNESGVFRRCEARGIEGLANILSVKLASIVTI